MANRTYDMGNKKVEARSFRVHLANGESVTYTQTDELMFIWMVGMTGELNIQRAVFHSKFAAKIEETRILCYAAGQWASVEVLDDEE